MTRAAHDSIFLQDTQPALLYDPLYNFPACLFPQFVVFWLCNHLLEKRATDST